jgi:hypothetical protein
MPDAAESSEPLAQQEKSWVWYAALESRAADKVSVLACAEALFAVALYWWIAIEWDTHWHLLSSIFVAPLLLLRSPESVIQGVNWFLEDWANTSEHFHWSRTRIWQFYIGFGTPAAVAGLWFANQLSTAWLADQSGWLWVGWFILIICFTMPFAASVLVAVETTIGSGPLKIGEPLFLGVIARLSAVGFAVMPTSAVIGWASAWEGGWIASFVGAWSLCLRLTLGWAVFMLVALLLAMAGGTALRALLCRVGATTRNLTKGLRCVPENWKETNFLIDSTLPAELMPGIRQKTGLFSSDALLPIFGDVGTPGFRFVLGTLTSLIFFLPALLYRLNIKATCWFWWPLAYFLKPLPNTDKVSQQKQALCWPWDNRMQNLLILVPAVLVIALLIYHYCDPAAWAELKNASAVPIPLKLILGMEWTYLPPWHWALLIIEITGLGMLWISGSASSHKLNHNWKVYSQAGMKRDLLLMEWLTRVRSLASIGLMLLGLGMCLISFPDWRKHLPQPILQQLESFYHTQELREQERLQNRASEQSKDSGDTLPTTPTSGPPKP